MHAILVFHTARCGSLDFCNGISLPLLLFVLFSSLVASSSLPAHLRLATIWLAPDVVE